MNPTATKLLVAAVTAVLLVPGVAPALDRAVRDLDGAGISSAAGGPFEPTLPAIQANVFTPGCAMSYCHGESQTANLDLRDGASYSHLVNVPSVEVPTLDRVTPFDPDASYLICKLEDCPFIQGQQMPAIGGPLDQAVIDVIRTWIELGAPEFPSVAVDGASWGRVKTLYR